MSPELILASASKIRLSLLQSAGIATRAVPARIDEPVLVAALAQENARPRDIADALAEMKARKISVKYGDALVLGCDQVLALGPTLLFKPASREDATMQLRQLQGQTHDLFSAMVVYEKGKPVWRFVGHVSMTMRKLTDAEIAAYVQENWYSIQDAVGCYKIEEAGRDLFAEVLGDASTIQGLPLSPLVAYFQQRGFL